MEDLLPAELTIDILSRLPVKTIIYCKCVCKKWRNLLVESSFVHLHLSRSPTTLIFHHDQFFGWKVLIGWNDLYDPGVLEWVEIEDKDDYHHLHNDPVMSLDLNLAPILQKSLVYLVGSVNGLICLSQIHDNTCICNPVTREYMIIPSQQQYFRKHKEIIIYGFGVSSLTGEYKVIRTFRRHKSDILEAEVYTLGTSQWRELGRVPYDLYVSSGYRVPFLNNHCHWIVSDDDEDAPEKLSTFDFDNETFQLFPSPPPPSLEEGSEYHYQRLVILKGCLCKTDSYDVLFTIWVMKEYGIKESWHKEVVINLAISPPLYWPTFEPLNLIEGLKDGSILTLYRSQLWAFYPNDKTIEDTGLFEFSPSVSGLAYRPSFVKLQNFELERVYMF